MFHKVVQQHMQGVVGFSLPTNCKFTRESSNETFLKSVKIYGHESVAPLFWPTLYTQQ